MKLPRTHIVPCLPFVARRTRRACSDVEDCDDQKSERRLSVVSTKGRNLGGPYKSLGAAKKRLREVEFFKHRKP